jgi:hypothetical protein
MPNDSIWQNSNYVGKTCQQLEADFSANPEKWCNVLSNGVVSDHTPRDACCFCGGGEFAEEFCENLSFSDVTAENAINCSDIEDLPNVDEFCIAHGDDTFSKNGLTMKEACCVCGGGENVIKYSGGKLTARKLVDVSSPLVSSILTDLVSDLEDGSDTATVNHNIFYHDQVLLNGGFSPVST